MPWIILAAALGAGLGWLALLILRDHLAHKKVKAVVSALSDSQLESISALIEHIGTVPSRGYIGLVRGFGKANGRLTVILPSDLADFPWSGQVVEVVATPDGPHPVEFRIHELSVHGDEGLILRWLAIPAIRVGQKNRAQNVFAIDRYIQQSAALRETLNRLHPADPKLLLAQLLSVDGRHVSLEPFDQLRCGLPPAWIQSPRFHKCPTCRRPMRLILQVPGVLLGPRVAEGSFYLFGCPSHRDQIATDEDWG